MLKILSIKNKKKFMGREFMGIIRTTFLIDKKGKIIKIWDLMLKLKITLKKFWKQLRNFNKIKRPLISKGPLTFKFIER